MPPARSTRSARALAGVGLCIAALVAVGCGAPSGGGTLTVFNAGSLARPLRAALDSFARVEGVTIAQESAGSLETARKLTELGNVPDIIALADAEVFPGYLVPAHVEAYVAFARNRMVLAYTDRSRFAAEVSADNWWQIVQRPGVEVGRSDPELDPNGYRTLMVWQLAARHYGDPALAATLEAHAPPRNIRPKEADLVGLLQAGELDYIWSYESIARAVGLRWVALPVEIDLSSPDHAAQYAAARVTVRGASGGGSVTFIGAPIVYAFAVPRAAPHPELAARFAAFLVSPEGRAILRREGLDALDTPRHTGAPPAWFTGAP
ncbi:MAG: extracellular solute-binding protein [Gemmatimonadaceae bacterium]